MGLVELLFQQTDRLVAIKCITKKNLTKSQSLLSKEIKILQVCSKIYRIFLCLHRSCDSASVVIFIPVLTAVSAEVLFPTVCVLSFSLLIWSIRLPCFRVPLRAPERCSTYVYLHAYIHAHTYARSQLLIHLHKCVCAHTYSLSYLPEGRISFSSSTDYVGDCLACQWSYRSL